MDRLDDFGIIVVDDEEDIRESIHDALTRLGADVRCTATVGEALEQLRRHKADAIVCDWHLGPERGDTLLALARDEFPTVGRILLTGSAPREWLHVVKAALADVVVKKPFALVELSDAVLEAVRLARRNNAD